jgi:hypothetical protein
MIFEFVFKEIEKGIVWYLFWMRLLVVSANFLYQSLRYCPHHHLSGVTVVPIKSQVYLEWCWLTFNDWFQIQLGARALSRINV